MDVMNASLHTATAREEFVGDDCNDSNLAECLSRCCSFSSIHSTSSCRSDSSSWIEVEQASFKSICDKYEKRRRLDENVVGNEGLFFRGFFVLFTKGEVKGYPKSEHFSRLTRNLS